MSDESRPWWKKRRVLLPAASFLLLAVALAVAIVRSDTSQVMVHNETGAALSGLVVSACGQQMTFPEVPDETSIRMRLAPQGEATAVELSLASGAWRWEGSYLEPRGGYLIFIRLRRDRDVEVHSQISFWQRVVFGRAASE